VRLIHLESSYDRKQQNATLLFLVFHSAHNPSKTNNKTSHTQTNKQTNNTIITMTVPAATKLPVMAEESIMAPKEHGTSATPVQSDLRWGCQNQLADRYVLLLLLLLLLTPSVTTRYIRSLTHTPLVLVHTFPPHPQYLQFQ
jgi:hypothetical protein